MVRVRLFRKDDPSVQIDSRVLDEGELVVGRDAKADWPIADPERGISRRHLVIASRGGLVTLRDTSSNGVFLGERRERAPADRAVPIERGEAIRFGGYLLVVEEERRAAAPAAAAAPEAAPFGSPAGRDDADGASGRRHPFASALKPDPFGTAGAVGTGDAWEDRAEAPAGTWDAGRGRRPEHNKLIGAERPWTEPAPPAAAQNGYGFDTPFERPILERPAATPGAAAIPSDWMEAAAAPEPAAPAPPPIDLPAATPAPTPRPSPEVIPSEPMAPSHAVPPPPPPPPPASPTPAPVATTAPVPDRDEDALFLHFCAGAGLNPQHFAGEDRGRVMERLGGVYRQAVLGIADLMRERTTLRNEYRMVHTAVQPEGNNPFKWVPPQRIAVELLREEDGGYTTGERALNDALGDVKAHLLCTLAGMRAALAATFDALSPARVEARMGSRSYLIAAQRDAALWGEYVAMAEGLRVEAEDNPDGLANRAFRQGYEEQAAEIISGVRSWR